MSRCPLSIFGGHNMTKRGPDGLRYCNCGHKEVKEE